MDELRRGFLANRDESFITVDATAPPADIAGRIRERLGVHRVTGATMERAAGE